MIEVSIIGGSGYAGGELLRLLLLHPEIKVKQVTSRKFAERAVFLVHPNLRRITDLKFTDPQKMEPCDLLVIAIPNTKSMGMMEGFMKLAPKIIDLGADFRIHSQKDFEMWYKMDHEKPALLNQFVYGLPEIHREKIKKTNFVACPGCEATVSILTLYPLVKEGLINLAKIIIDAKMGSSQAGLQPTSSSHHAERSGVVRSYKPSGHRHTVEIQQELNFGKQPQIMISATAIEMVRGLLVTVHTEVCEEISEKDIWKAYRKYYGQEPFIKIIKERQGNYRYPEPKILVGTNYCDIGFELDKENNRLVLIGAIDNLMKGTAGSALQCINLMFGWKESLGLEFPGLHPV